MESFCFEPSGFVIFLAIVGIVGLSVLAAFMVVSVAEALAGLFRRDR